MSRPDRMVPRARCRMGLVMSELFSLVGVVGEIRVNPAWTRDVMRRL